MLKSATHTELLHTQTNAGKVHNSNSSEINTPYTYKDTGYWIRPTEQGWVITYNDYMVYPPIESKEECELIIECRDHKLLQTTMIAITNIIMNKKPNENESN